MQKLLSMQAQAENTQNYGWGAPIVFYPVFYPVSIPSIQINSGEQNKKNE